MKKLKSWLYWNGLDMLIIILFIFFVLLACLIGYTIGEKDGYAEGYISATTDDYVQSPGRSVLENAKELAQNIQKIAVLKTHREQTSAINTSLPELNILYADNTIYIEETLRQCLQTVPYTLLTQFQNDNWTLEICVEIPTLMYKGSEFDAAGLATSGNKKIIVEAGTPNLQNVLTHEFGHYLDFTQDELSKTEEWKTLYVTEWKGVYRLTHSFHNVDEPAEFFASVFSLYIRKPDLLQAMCPQSFAAMEQILKQYT